MHQHLERIRRQVYRLSSQDLNEHPIWEFCSDEEDVEGQDEATVRPSPDQEVPGYSAGTYVVAADVVFGDGTAGLGYVYSGKPDDVACIQPNVMSGSSQINFWLGSLSYRGDVKGDIARYFEILGRGRESVFPVSFRTRANVNGSPLKVVLEGFMARSGEGRVLIVG